jgi:LPS-assembly lipoprotein
MTRPHYLSIVSILLLALTVSACGFHLRGQVNLPPEMARTHIEGLGEYSELGRDLRRLLEGSGAQVVDTREEAGAILDIITNQASRRVLSVQAGGKVQEYELIQRLVFSVRTTDGRVLLAPQTLELNREYLYDRNDPLASGSQEGEIRDDMQRDIVQLLMRRLQALGTDTTD